MTGWTGLIARARGLSTHLLSPGALQLIESSPSLKDLSLRLAEFDYLATLGNVVPHSAADVEELCRRVAADRIAVLERWVLGDDDVLQPFTLAEDLRSIRSIVRGISGGADHDARLRGLVPTTALPIRALTRLASLNDVSEVGALLAVWHHPFAAAVLSGVTDQHLDLWHIDIALLEAWSTASLEVCHAFGWTSLRRFVSQTIDLENAITARLLAEQRLEARPEELFVAGGAFLNREELVTASKSHDVLDLVDRLADEPDTAAIRTALTSQSTDVEADILQTRIEQESARVRRDPLNLSVITLFFLRLRAEQRTIIGTAWQCELLSTSPTDRRSVA